MPEAIQVAPQDEQLVAGILERLTEELASFFGRPIELTSRQVERATTRPAGKGVIHISFRLTFTQDGTERHGALLLPLPEAITLADLLLLAPEEDLGRHRQEATLDGTLKGAMLEVGNMIGAAVHAALPGLGLSSWSVRSEGCQGVRADVRPAFPYTEGSELIVGRVTASIRPFPPFELLLILPAIG
jgi:hypothetical protein